MRKSISGYLFNKIEKLGDKDYNHIGCENPKFGDFIASFVPNLNDRRKVKITIETIDKKYGK